MCDAIGASGAREINLRAKREALEICQPAIFRNFGVFPPKSLFDEKMRTAQVALLLSDSLCLGIWCSGDSAKRP
jgi:hypothetical protein